MTSNDSRLDLARLCLGVLFIGGLILFSFWVLNPFLPAMIWGTTIVIATWPLFERAQTLLWGKRNAAVMLFTSILLLVFVIPVLMALGTLADEGPLLLSWANQLTHLDSLPMEWLNTIPWIGEDIFQLWETLLRSELRDLATKVSPYVGGIAKWLGAQLSNISLLVVHFLLTIIACGLLYSNGDSLAQLVRRFTYRLAGQQGLDAALLAAQAVRAVALSVVVTALLQASFAGLGLFVVQIPYAMVLTVVMFLLSVVQAGPLPILIPTTIYLYWTGDNVFGTLLLIWSVLAGSIDSIVRPILIQRGANLPLMLIFMGVLGGLFAFGIIGLFIGPVILAVAYTLLNAWIAQSATAAQLE